MRQTGAGVRWRHDEVAGMLRLQGISEPDLERQLLRRGVHDLAAGRHACADCGRTPLVGEHIHRYPRGKVVCELCRPLHAEAPQTSDIVRHSERGRAVRLRARVVSPARAAPAG